MLSERPVGAFLKPIGMERPRPFPGESGIGGARADGRPGDELGCVLGNDGIEGIRSRGEAELVDLNEEPSGGTEPPGDVVAVVQPGSTTNPRQPRAVRGFRNKRA
jgi:hypothetical protein